MNNVQREFSRNAKHYNQYNQIQGEVVKDLLAEIKDSPKRILDIGAGRGEVFSQITWPLQHFTALDFSSRMCELHPKNDYVEIVAGDFNNTATFEILRKKPYDRIVSASALQWADDLEVVFREIAAFKTPVALALFTSKTFACLHERLGVESPLHTLETIESAANSNFTCETFVKKYRLHFDSTRLMLEYIKKSGVSSGSKKMGVTHLRELIRENRLHSIEAEVIFITT